MDNTDNNHGNESTPSSTQSHMCDACGSEGNEVLADKFCQDCGEWLCSPCIGFHGRLKATRHHRIVNGSDICAPKEEVVEEENDVTERCVDHPKEFIKYHCETHRTLTCGHCNLKQHRSCKMRIIDEESKTFRSGSYLHKIAFSLLIKSTWLKKKIEVHRTRLEEHGKQTLADIDKYFEELTTHLTNGGANLNDRITGFVNDIECKLNNFNVECERIQTKIKSTTETLERHQTNCSQLYIETIRAHADVLDQEKILNEGAQEIQGRNGLKINENYKTDMWDWQHCGKLEIKTGNYTCRV